MKKLLPSMWMLLPFLLQCLFNSSQCGKPTGPRKIFSDMEDQHKPQPQSILKLTKSSRKIFSDVEDQHKPQSQSILELTNGSDTNCCEKRVIFIKDNQFTVRTITLMTSVKTIVLKNHPKIKFPGKLVGHDSPLKNQLLDRILSRQVI